MIFCLRILFLTILCSISFAAHGIDRQWSVAIESDTDAYGPLVDAAIKSPFFLDRLTCDSDVFIQPAEFLYLVDLPERTTITPEQIKRAIGYVRKKNKFKRIDLQAEPTQDGVHLHWQLTGMWTLSRVTLHGLMFGKEAYRHYYGIEPGEPFDENKHNHSLNALQEAFAQEGYFDGSAQATFDRDNNAKSVVVHLNLAKGDRFKIGNVNIHVQADETVGERDLDFAREFLDKKLKGRLASRWYSRDLINQEILRIKRLLAQQGYLQISIELKELRNNAEHTIDVTFHIDLHRKKEFIFVGNHFFSSEQLLDRILLFGGSAWMLPASIVQDELLEQYRKAGFWHAGMELEEQDDRTIILIQEGPRAIIDEVVCAGVAQFPENQWRTIFASLQGNYGDEAKLQKAIDQLLDQYTKAGFLDARVRKKEEVADPDEPDHYALQLTVDEGERTYVSSLRIELFPDLESQGPFKQYKQAQSDGVPLPFDLQHLKEQQRWLTEQCKKNGYTRVEVTPECTRTNNTMAIAWKINVAKNPVRFGKTVVVNNSTFPFDYVVRELQYQEGAEWDQEKIKQTHNRLKALGLFETIHLFPQDAGHGNEEKAVVLTLYPDDPHELRARVGFGLQQVARHMKFGGVTYKVGGTFIKRSPFNCGDLFRIDGDITRSQRTLSVQYARPWLFDRPIRTVLQGYNNRYIQPAFVGSIKSLYEVVQQGLLLGLTRNYRGVTTGVNLGFEIMETNIVQNDVADMFAHKIAHAINFEPRLLDRSIPYFLFEPTILCDLLDNKVQPTRGSFTLASLKAMLPFGQAAQDAHFVKFLIEQSFFVPLGRAPIVFAFRLRFGHIFHSHFSSMMPSERFYLGGAYSIRSYDTDFCPPLGCFVDECGRKQLVPQGGKSMANAMIELRFPLYKNLSGVLFQDLGLLSKTVFADIVADGVLAGTGFGLRVNTPLGPLRFDIGFKWRSHDPTPFTYAWFLTFGNAF